MFDLAPDLPVVQTAPHARTLGEMLRLRMARSASNPALYSKERGTWVALTWQDVHRRAASIARGLLALGCERGDRVAILGPTQPVWGLYDLGAQLAGMVGFGIYPKQSVEQVRYLLEHSEAGVIFVDGEDELEVVLEAAKGVASLIAIVPWSEALYREVRDRDRRIRSPVEIESGVLSEGELLQIQEDLAPDDTAILIYTSGTTGPPKGAMITHRNILSLLSAQAARNELRQSDLGLSFLPMAHAAERILSFYGRINSGVPSAYAQSTGTVLEDLREVRPTVFGAVPRIFEKAYTRIYSELESKSPAVRRLFAWAVKVGKERAKREMAGAPIPAWLRPQLAIADRLVFKRVREAFGGRVRFLVTGAAPIQIAILELFWAVGLPVYEAYGMTEATVLTHSNYPRSIKLGSVGKIIAPMEQRIAEDGEILLRGPWVFKGYFKNPEATAETLAGGWLHTGDVGVLDADGYLRITDRKKHLIITAGGKNLSPANIEKAIKDEEPLISQVHAHGDRRSYVTAVIAPSPIETLEWGVARGLCTKEELAARTAELIQNPAGRSASLNAAMAKVVAHPELKERIKQAVQRANQHLARVEQVKRFVILDRDFSQEQGELTPTMKIKRKEVEQKYADLFARMYDEKGFALEA